MQENIFLVVFSNWFINFEVSSLFKNFIFVTYFKIVQKTNLLLLIIFLFRGRRLIRK